MTRRLSNVLTTLSLLICIAVAGLWVQSVLRPVRVGRWTVQSRGSVATSAEFQAYSTAGGLSIRHTRVVQPPNEFIAENRLQPFNGTRWRVEYPGEDYPYYRKGFAGIELSAMTGLQWMRERGRSDIKVLTLPYWLLLVLSAGVPVLRLLSNRLKRRR